MVNIDDLGRSTKNVLGKILTALIILLLFAVFFILTIKLTIWIFSNGMPFLAVLFYFMGIVFSTVLPFLIVGLARSIHFWDQVKKNHRLHEQNKYRPDGQPYPPTRRGLCDNCGLACEKVYYLSSGARLCPDCYQEFLKGN